MISRLLIVEESLRDRKAHWYSYIRTIARAGADAGTAVDVACNRKADQEVIESFCSFPIFDHSVYLDQHKRRLPGERYYGVVLHSIRTIRALWPLLKKQKRYDEAFVATVLMRHLLAWWFIVTFHPQRPRRTTLFFVATPGVWKVEAAKAIMPRSSILMQRLVRLFGPAVRRGSIRFGVETKTALKEYESLTGLPFNLFPHPVELHATPQGTGEKRALKFCCYGFARHEKGSDLLLRAIERIVSRHALSDVSFVVQWLEPFKMPDGSECGAASIKNNDRVNVIDHALGENEYLELLKDTDCMLLPYRNSSYYSRLSRVAIEAVIMGIPIVYTRGGWLEEIAIEYGAGIGITDGSIDELEAAIGTMAGNIDAFKIEAAAKAPAAHQFFSGARFIDILSK